MINAISQLTSVSQSAGVGKSLLETAIGGAAGVAKATPGVAQGLSFAETLAGMATQAMSDVKGAEAASFAGINGTATTREVVDAVMTAEQSLQTAIALRDKLVSAYLEITKMQI